MKFGVHLLQAGPRATAPDIFRVATAAEDLGYDSVWLFDHLLAPTQVARPYPGTADGTYDFPPESPFYEAVAVLAALAGVTKRVKLGTRVLVPLYRPPVVL